MSRIIAAITSNPCYFHPRVYRKRHASSILWSRFPRHAENSYCSCTSQLQSHTHNVKNPALGSNHSRSRSCLAISGRFSLLLAGTLPSIPHRLVTLWCTEYQLRLPCFTEPGIHIACYIPAPLLTLSTLFL